MYNEKNKTLNCLDFSFFRACRNLFQIFQAIFFFKFIISKWLDLSWCRTCCLCNLCGETFPVSLANNIDNYFNYVHNFIFKNSSRLHGEWHFQFFNLSISLGSISIQSLAILVDSFSTFFWIFAYSLHLSHFIDWIFYAWQNAF